MCCWHCETVCVNLILLQYIYTDNIGTCTDDGLPTLSCLNPNEQSRIGIQSNRLRGRYTAGRRLYWTRASLHSAHIENILNAYTLYTTIIIAKQHNKLTFCPYFVLRRLSEWKAIRCEPRRYPHATRFRILQQAFGSVVCCASANFNIHVIPCDTFYHANNIVKCNTASENH